MFWATHRSSSGAQKLKLQPLVLHMSVGAGTQFPLDVDSGRHPQTYKNQRLQLQFLISWWWGACRSKHVEQLINIGIINSSTLLHLVGYFCMIYTMMHGSTNNNIIIIKVVIVVIMIMAFGLERFHLNNKSFLPHFYHIDVFYAKVYRDRASAILPLQEIFTNMLADSSDSSFSCFHSSYVLRLPVTHQAAS